MNPPPIRHFRQGFAHGFIPARKGFAQGKGARQSARSDRAAATRGPICLNCYPSPIFLPDPIWVRPFFWCGPATGGTESRASREFGLATAQIVVIIEPIITKQRGTNRCVSNPSFLLRLRQLACRVVCKTRPRAAWVALLPGPWLLTRWMKTSSRVRPSAGLAGRHLARSPVSWAASRATDTPTCGSATLQSDHSGQRPDGLLRLRTN
jgi:hypothetical protein